MVLRGESWIVGKVLSLLVSFNTAKIWKWLWVGHVYGSKAFPPLQNSPNVTRESTIHLNVMNFMAFYGAEMKRSRNLIIPKTIYGHTATRGLGQRQRRRLVDFLFLVNDFFQWCENNSARLCACFTWEICWCEAVYKSIRGITVAFTLYLSTPVLSFPHWEFSVGHWELSDPSQGLFFLLNVSFASRNAAGHKLAWDIGRSQTLTDSRAWLRNKQAVKREWRFASEKIRVAFGSAAKMHPCSRCTTMATGALCLPPVLSLGDPTLPKSHLNILGSIIDMDIWDVEAKLRFAHQLDNFNWLPVSILCLITWTPV